MNNETDYQKAIRETIERYQKDLQSLKKRITINQKETNKAELELVQIIENNKNPKNEKKLEELEEVLINLEQELKVLLKETRKLLDRIEKKESEYENGSNSKENSSSSSSNNSSAEEETEEEEKLQNLKKNREETQLLIEETKSKLLITQNLKNLTQYIYGIVKLGLKEYLLTNSNVNETKEALKEMISQMPSMKTETQKEEIMELINSFTRPKVKVKVKSQAQNQVLNPSPTFKYQ